MVYFSVLKAAHSSEIFLVISSGFGADFTGTPDFTLFLALLSFLGWKKSTILLATISYSQLGKVYTLIGQRTR